MISHLVNLQLPKFTISSSSLNRPGLLNMLIPKRRYNPSKDIKIDFRPKKNYSEKRSFGRLFKETSRFHKTIIRKTNFREFLSKKVDKTIFCKINFQKVYTEKLSYTSKTLLKAFVAINGEQKRRDKKREWHHQNSLSSLQSPLLISLSHSLFSHSLSISSPISPLTFSSPISFYHLLSSP